MTITVRRLYRYLKTIYPHVDENWWPGEDPFEIAVGAVLTQNTSWSNAYRALLNLKNKGCLKPEQLIRCEELEELIKPAGFYTRKSYTLRELSRLFVKYGINELQSMNTQALRNKLLSIKGIGYETADSILLYAFGRPVFVVDKYTYRIFLRTGLYTGRFDYERIRVSVEKEINSLNELKEFHALLVEHAKLVCRKKPVCERCKMNSICPKNGL